MDTDVERIVRALRTIRLPLVKEERQLHLTIAVALDEAGIAYQREAMLGPYARVDFLCGSVAIEAKKGLPNRRTLMAQLMRYAGSEKVSALILVTERSAHMPESLLGKPLHLVVLNRLWGVAL